MNRLKIVLAGTLTGLSITMAAALLTIAGRKALFEVLLNQAVSRDAVISLMAISFTIGAISGAVVVPLVERFTAVESRLLALLASIAIGSVGVMLGGFSSGSRIPLAIYGIAIVNGLLTIPIYNKLNRRLKFPHVGGALG